MLFKICLFEKFNRNKNILKVNESYHLYLFQYLDTNIDTNLCFDAQRIGKCIVNSLWEQQFIS